MAASLLDTVTVPPPIAAAEGRAGRRAGADGRKPEAGLAARRIVVIGGYAPALISFRGDLIAAMAAAGHEVIACAPGAHPEVAEALRARGARYLPVEVDRSGTNPLADLASLLSLRRLFRQLRPDLVLAYTAKAVIYGAGAARLAGVPHIFAMITGLGYAFIEGRELKRRILRQMTTRLYRASLAGCEAILFQNRDDLEEFRRTRIVAAGKRLVRVEGSGVDTAHYGFAPAAPEPPTFLLIARLLRDKGIVEYVEAARRLRAEHPQARFRLLGPMDPNPAGLSADMLEGWRREGAIEYLGEAADVRPHLRACMVYVLPSYREGMPRTVLEAMATGRAIVTTDAPGCRETVVEGENGFLVPPRDAGALAAAMRRFIAQPALAVAMGERSRALAEQRFDVHRVNAVMLEAMGLR
ncbi:MAG TPA: glycosyltransferase family 4 protein [Geminicoccaceae bacterium]|nr:glycosyltransferase family 4 protein [Geminicoccaceae bacterium]